MQCMWLKRIPSESWLNPDLLFAVPAAVKQSFSAGDRWRGMEVSATAQGESEGRPVKNQTHCSKRARRERYLTDTDCTPRLLLVSCKDETLRSCPLTPSLSFSLPQRRRDSPLMVTMKDGQC